MAGRGKGRPFAKGESGNPGGRPADGPWREQSRAAASAFLAERVRRASKMKLPELERALADSAIHGGLFTELQLQAMEQQQMRVLSEVLAGANLTDEHRTAIINDVMARQRHEGQRLLEPAGEVIPAEPLPDPPAEES